MMMPANYSVIAENEMTYVNGGANAFIDAIGAVTAPIWGIENVKQFSTNIVTLIGSVRRCDHERSGRCCCCLQPGRGSHQEHRQGDCCDLWFQDRSGLIRSDLKL